MKFRIGGLAMALCAALAAGAHAQTVEDILGPWKMNIEAMGQTMDMTITFSQSGSELGALISTPRGDAPATNVKLEGDQLSWDAEMGPTQLSLKVTVDGDTFAGTSETPFGTVVLNGTKYTAEEIAAMGAKYDHLVGDWDTTTEFNGQTFESKLRLEVVDGRLMGAIIGGGGRQRPGDEAAFFVSLDGDTLRWDVQLPYITNNGGEAEVTIADGLFEGTVTSELGEIPIRGSLVDTAKLVLSPYDDPEAILGQWDVVAEVSGSRNDVTMTVEEVDGRLRIVATSDVGEFTMEDVDYNKIGDTMGVIRMTANIPELSPNELLFELIIDGDEFEGEELNTGSILLTGKKSGTAPAAAEPEGLTGRHVMALLDRDRDGTISMDEAPEQLKQNFMMVDANADGGIDAGEAELIAMFINGQYGGPGKGANEIIAAMMVGMLDADMDGKVSEDEVTIEEMKANFGMVDANSDGFIDADEALVIGDLLMQQAEAEEPGQVTAAMIMQMLDTDGDGKISMEEAPDQLKQNFMMVDANADGGIDAGEAEMIAMFLNSQGGISALQPESAQPESEGPDRSALSPEQIAILDLVERGMDALVASDIDAMMDIYADDFESDQGTDKAGQEQFMRDAQAQGFLDGIQYDLTPLEIVVENGEATAGPIDLEGAFGMLTVEFELKKQPDGEWKVTYQSQY